MKIREDRAVRRPTRERFGAPGNPHLLYGKRCLSYIPQYLAAGGKEKKGSPGV